MFFFLIHQHFHFSSSECLCLAVNTEKSVRSLKWSVSNTPVAHPLNRHRGKKQDDHPLWNMLANEQEHGTNLVVPIPTCL